MHRRSRHCATLDACQALPRPLRSFLRDPIAAAGNTESGLAGRRIERNGPAAVLAARERQMLRQNKLNAHLENREMKNCCRLRREDAVWLEQTLTQLGLSIRARQRLLKVARTIADLAEVEEIERCHLQEALSYRAMIGCSTICRNDGVKRAYALFLSHRFRCNRQRLPSAVCRRTEYGNASAA